MWFRVDDGFAGDPKVWALPPGRRWHCVGIWAAGGAWCTRYLTDGRIPKTVFEQWDEDGSAGRLLVDVGLLEDDGDHYQFHDWSDYQLTRAEALKIRDGNKERQRKWRAARADNDVTNTVTDGVTNAVTNDVSNAVSNTTQTKPNQTSYLTTLNNPDADENDDEQPREDVEQLTTRLRDLMVGNGSRPPTITKAWRDSARLLLDTDGIALADALTVLDWSQADAFWSGNIHSLGTFRKQFDKLRMHMRRTTPPGGEDDADPWENYPTFAADADA